MPPNRRQFLGMMLMPALAMAQSDAPLKLPPPQLAGTALVDALKARKSSREFSEKPLPLAVLSNLLWAAFGINRSQSSMRTAPSAHNWQETEVYVALAEGMYNYDARAHALRQIVSGDLRRLTGVQEFAARAPLNLVYVANLSSMTGARPEDQTFYSAADAGFISQNVYLVCAAEGLATVVRGLIDRNALSAAMRLRAEQRIVLAQTVGYPT
ncbi:MAG TPA: SagB/ThcOx family dehydrogenase [Burkholderiales bacterium]|nr:SagB/ThcOx family dehydrogenase [Burkholderiales bacterium]